MSDLSKAMEQLFARGKGILAADESPTSADKRLVEHGVKAGPAMRQKFRELFLATPGMEKFVSGVILHEETLGQKSESGALFPNLLAEKGVIPGIKVDQGTEPMPEHEEELLTNGLLGLGDRLQKYHDKSGTRFTKWRAVLRIEGDHLPSSTAIVENAKRLASYACEVQRTQMVPLLEPEVLYDGTHSRLRCREVLETVLGTVVRQLEEQCADPSMTIIKTSMVMSGEDSKKKDTPEEVAEDTVGALMASVPKEIGGIVFLSGGQSPEQSLANLSAIMKLARAKEVPWPITFSFARTFQEEALDIWAGKDENMDKAREAFLTRLREASEDVS